MVRQTNTGVVIPHEDKRLKAIHNGVITLDCLLTVVIPHEDKRLKAIHN